MPFFSSKKKVKMDLTEHHRDKRKMGQNVDPTRAITEDEPWAIALVSGKGISQMRHKDQYGNEITDPDRSNPTRHRMERPLETIRSFERAIYNDEREYPRRPNRQGYDQQNSQRASMAYQYGDQSARQSVYDNYDNSSTHSHRPGNQRHSGYENYNGNRHRGEFPVTSDTNSGSYMSNGGSGWSGDPYSTNPSSDASGYVNYEQQQQYNQSARLPLGPNDKPLPPISRQPSGNSQPANNGYNSQPQYQQYSYGQQQQQYGSYNGNSQFASPTQGQYKQYYGQQQAQQSTWNSQPVSKMLSKSSTDMVGKSGGQKRRSWFRRSKTAA